ncbi:MAG: helix-turn-helix domain-containing protein [Planctomycetota bacterium]
MGLTTQAAKHADRIPTTLLGLQKRFLGLRPIHKKADYQYALEVATELSSRTNLTSEQADYLEVLATLVADYEEKHFEMSRHSPQEILKFLVEENQMSGSDLGRILGSRTLGPALLRGQRSLSKTHIKKLADHFSVSPALFFG